MCSPVIIGLPGQIKTHGEIYVERKPKWEAWKTLSAYESGSACCRLVPVGCARLIQENDWHTNPSNWKPMEYLTPSCASAWKVFLNLLGTILFVFLHAILWGPGPRKQNLWDICQTPHVAALGSVNASSQARSTCHWRYDSSGSSPMSLEVSWTCGGPRVSCMCPPFQSDDQFDLVGTLAI